MFPVKFITKTNMINSNHNALKINVLEYGVGEVSCPASRNVPIAIETAKVVDDKRWQEHEASMSSHVTNPHGLTIARGQEGSIARPI